MSRLPTSNIISGSERLNSPSGGGHQTGLRDAADRILWRLTRCLGSRAWHISRLEEPDPSPASGRPVEPASPHDGSAAECEPVSTERERTAKAVRGPELAAAVRAAWVAHQARWLDDTEGFPVEHGPFSETQVGWQLPVRREGETPCG